MQLEKEKKEKRERERCRALAQRIAEEANPASAALLGEQMSLLTEALHRAGVEAEEWTEGSEAELLVVADPAWETLPETLPARVLLVSDESTVMAGWAEQLAQRGYFRDFGWRSKGRAQPSALFCTSQPTQLKMVRGYEMEMDILRDRMVRAERTSGEEAELIARLRSDLSLSRSHEQQLEKALGDSTTALLGERAAPDLLRLTPRTVSGAEMLQAVCTPVGIAPENVLVLAGSMPMLELVRAASRSAAAADAPAELRLAAKQVTLTDVAGGAAVEVLYRMVRDAEKLA